jgi:pimeloyl-ACP methyl ester carboxylesterase
LTDALVDSGFCAIVYDPRDAGLSTHLSEYRLPSFGELLRMRAAGTAPSPPYTLQEMADDLLGLIASLGKEQVHLIGQSIGGCVAMLAALGHRERFRTLITISSTADNNGRLGPLSDPSLFVIGDICTSYYLPETELESVAWQRWVRSGTGHVMPRDLSRRLAETMISRNHDAEGALRQAYAFLSSEPFHDRLDTLSLPTLVLHGTEDFLFDVEHPKDIASRIPGSALKIYEGAGHNVPPSLVPTLVADVSELCRAST